MTKNPVIKAGSNKITISVIVLVFIINNIITVNIQPVPNIIKSIIVKNPSINIDFLELAGIR